MNVLLFGTTGMVGQGVLRECLLATDVDAVQTVGRAATGHSHAKLRDLVLPDLFDYSKAEAELQHFDACFFCLGVSSSGISEADYSHLTYDLTLTAAETLARLNPQMTFVYVSGAGTDSTEQGRVMWARVKGHTENALLRLPFKAAYMFRPGIIQPLNGAKSKTPAYRLFYTAMAPLMPVLKILFRRSFLTTKSLGQAMLAVTRHGAPKPILEAVDINEIAARQAGHG